MKSLKIEMFMMAVYAAMCSLLSAAIYAIVLAVPHAAPGMALVWVLWCLITAFVFFFVFRAAAIADFIYDEE